MIELKTRPFVILENHKKYILAVILLIYIYCVYKGYPFELISLCGAIPFLYLISAENPSNYLSIKFSNEHIEIDDQIFEYRDLKFYGLHHHAGRHSKRGFLSLGLKFIKNNELYDFWGEVDEVIGSEWIEAKKQVDDLIEAKVQNGTVVFDSIDSFKENYSSNRFMLLSFLWTLYTVIATTVVFMFVTSTNYQNGNEYNSYFWIPLIPALLLGSLHFYLLGKGYRSAYKMASITKNKKRKFDRITACLAGLIIYLFGIQSLYWVNKNIGAQEFFSVNPTVSSRERAQGRKRNCNLRVVFHSEELARDFSFDMDCKFDEQMKVGSTYPFEIYRGSLGGFYFTKKPF